MAVSTDPREYPVMEATTGHFTALLEDEAGNPIPGSTLTGLTLTLYADDVDLTIINGRNAQDVLQINGVTVSEFGLLTWTIAALDNAILNDALPFERHIALFQWTWGVAKHGAYELVLVVRNLAKV